MRPRRAVLLTPLSRSVHTVQLPSYNSPSPITPLESTLLQVFILKNLKPIRMNTYKKSRGRGLLWLTKIPSRCYLPKQQVPGVSSGSSVPLESIDYKRPIGNLFVFKSIQTARGCTPPPPNILARNARNNATRPLSFQSLASCPSRNSFLLITFHFHGGVYPPLPLPPARIRFLSGSETFRVRPPYRLLTSLLPHLPPVQSLRFRQGEK